MFFQYHKNMFKKIEIGFINIILKIKNMFKKQKYVF